MQIVQSRSLADLPHFNPDLDGDALPASALMLRREIGASHGVLICSPEYARGIAGSLKNALDWLVSSLEFPETPVAVINASQRASDADASLRLILKTMSARLVEPASITLPLLGRSLQSLAIPFSPSLFTTSSTNSISCPFAGNTRANSLSVKAKMS
jgi:NAD(P)H-dependent FMN reductase